MTARIRRSTFKVAAIFTIAMLAMAVQATSVLGKTPRFGTPVRLPTWESCGGYEPGIAIDKFGNIFVTAHKQNHCLVVANDPGAPLGVRSQSWLWTSKDGVNWSNPPGLENLFVDPSQLDFGDEGDIALDDAPNPHLYFVDTKVVDNSLTRWTISGPGTANMLQDMHRTAIPTAEEVDDRPWVIAHGPSTVMYAGNEGDKDTYNAGSTTNGCTGSTVLPPLPGQQQSPVGGRYTVFMSYDGGATFDPVGCTLPDSGWCRPAADHKPGSQYLYMFCTNDAGADDEVNNPGDPGFTVGTLWTYVSADDGHTWQRYKVDNYNANLDSGSNTNGDITWSQITVARDGSVYALFNNPISNADQVKTGSQLLLYRSKDHGKTWKRQDVTPANPGLIRYSWLAVSKNNRVGVAYESHPDINGAWHVYAGVSKHFNKPVHYTLADPTEVAPAGDFVFGDFFEIAFDPHGRLNVVYTRCTDLVPGDDSTNCLNSDIYFVRST
jgi:hypothetical protein